MFSSYWGENYLVENYFVRGIAHLRSPLDDLESPDLPTLAGMGVVTNATTPTTLPSQMT
jgi:hypothetical protein